MSTSKKRVAIALVLAAACPAVVLGSEGGKSLELLAGRVTDVADGDTVTFVSGGRNSRVRLDAIDAPELAQTYGTRAHAALERLCLGQSATLRVEKLDRVGRSVGTLTCAGRDVNTAMVQGGHAWVFERFVPATSPLFALQTEARNAKRGLWANRDAVPPWVWREQKREEQPWLSQLYDWWQRWRSG
jgi:endonuclease YncB( thermonuclease family)